MSTVIKAGNVTTGGSITPDSTGILELKTGTGAGTTALTLDASQNATFAGTLKAAGLTTSLYPLTSGTAVASTSGTSIDFTGIPSWAKRITVMFSGVSTNGTNNYLIQLGSGSADATGYNSYSARYGSTTFAGSAYTTGFGVNSTLAANSVNGLLIISNLNANVWVASGNFSDQVAGNGYMTAGSKTLSGVLDRIRITTGGGTDTFDAGTINIMYE